jgi:hypothetical protein
MQYDNQKEIKKPNYITPILAAATLLTTAVAAKADDSYFLNVRGFSGLNDSVSHQNISYDGNNSPTDNVGDKGNSFSGIELGVGKRLFNMCGCTFC